MRSPRRRERSPGGGIVAVKGLGGYQLDLRRHRRTSGAPAPRAQAPPGQAIRGHGARTSRRARALARVGRADEGRCSPSPGPADRARQRDDRTPVSRPPRPSPADPAGRALPSVHAAAPPAAATTSAGRWWSPAATGRTSRSPSTTASPRAGSPGSPTASSRHDRPIRARYDDSVTRVVGRGPSVIRRARGYAPAPLPLPIPAPGRSSPSVRSSSTPSRWPTGGGPIVGPHTGDLEDAGHAGRVHRNARRHLCRLQGSTRGTSPTTCTRRTCPRSSPRAVAGPASDRGPAPPRARRRRAPPSTGSPVRSSASPTTGSGSGDDGTFWGGEMLVADLTGYRRVGRFGPHRCRAARPQCATPPGWRWATCSAPRSSAALARRPGLRRPLHSTGSTRGRSRSSGRMVEREAERPAGIERRPPVRRGGEPARSLRRRRRTRARRRSKLEAAAGGRASAPSCRGASPTPTVAAGSMTPCPRCAALSRRAAAGRAPSRLAAAFHRRSPPSPLRCVERARRDAPAFAPCACPAAASRTACWLERLPAALRADGLRVLINRQRSGQRRRDQLRPGGRRGRPDAPSPERR